MKTFEKFWEEYEYKFDNCNLSSVELGWNLCLSMMNESILDQINANKFKERERIRLDELAKTFAYINELEAAGKFEEANRIRPCCDNEDRGMNGGCKNCGDPCF